MLRRTGHLIACAALSGCPGCSERARPTIDPGMPATAAGPLAVLDPTAAIPLAMIDPTAAGPLAVIDPAATPLAAADPSMRPALSAARALALQAPPGASAVDLEIAALSRRLQAAPGAAELWSSLGVAWIKKARAASAPALYRNASACAEIALAIAEGDRASLDLRGLVLLHERRFAEARDAAERALALDEGDAVALGTLSDASLALGRFDAAAEAAQRMMDQRPSLPSYARAAHLRWLQGDVATATRAIRLAADAADPREPEALAWVLVQGATMLWHEGDHDGADRGFARALAVLGEYPPALAGRGRVALARGASGRAIELLERARRRAPDAEVAWLLGDARAAAGDAAGAAQAYAEVVTLGRQSDRRTLALYYATKDLERAEALRLASEERAIRGDIHTEDVLAWALYRSGKLEEARAASDSATALGTRDARLLYHAGAIRLALGHVKDGERLVRAALALNPKFDATGAAEAARLLARLSPPAAETRRGK